MARRKAPQTPASPPRQHSLIWLQGLLCGAMATLATPTALLLGVLLGPALLAVVLDHQPGRPRARSIALCSMAAAVDPLRTLWTDRAQPLPRRPRCWAIADDWDRWSATAAGWLSPDQPIAVRAALEELGHCARRPLRAERAKLVETWGLETLPGDE